MWYYMKHNLFPLFSKTKIKWKDMNDSNEFCLGVYYVAESLFSGIKCVFSCYHVMSNNIIYWTT